MSVKDRALQLVENDLTINRLLLIGLLIASPSLHYLCYYNSFDPVWLRGINCLFCSLALGLSFTANKTAFKYAIYATVISFLFINNCILLGVNGFGHVYLFSTITIFISLTLFCKHPPEFVSLSILNIIAVVTAYFTAPQLFISGTALIVLVFVFTIIAYVSFFVMRSYQLQFKKTVFEVMQLNESLVQNDARLRESRQQLHALISSANDTVFEFNEDKVCINVWFGLNSPAYLSREQFFNKRLADVLGDENAKQFDDAIEYVVQHKQSISFEFASVFGLSHWFVSKTSPIFDINGNYTGRISITVTDITSQKQRADALHNSEALLLQAQAIAKTGNWWYDGLNNENYWSPNLYKLLEIDAIPDGLTKFEYYLTLVHPDDRENAAWFLKNISKPGQVSFDHKMITPKGSLKYIKILRGDLQVKEDGTVKRVIGIIQDVTEARLTEKAVKISQAELLEAQAIAKIGNWKWDSATSVLSWSDEINNIYEAEPGSPTSSRQGKRLIQYIHPDDIHVVKNVFNAATGTTIEYRIITPKNNVKYIRVITGKLMHREDGTLRKIVGTLQDITDQKLLEIDNKRTQDKFRLVLENINLVALSLDSGGNVIFCNKYLAKLLGYSQQEILGMNWMQNFIPDEIGDMINTWFENNTIEAQYINPVLCRNGETRIISWQNTVTYDESGKIKETTSIGEDVTLQQKARQELITAKENAERSSHFKSEFLSIMSHEIRTPMNAVIGTTNLLLSENPKPEQLEYLNTLKFSGENLLAIINDILDYNKIEAGKLVLSHAPFDLHHLIQNVSKSFHPKAIEKNLKIELKIDDTLPQHVLGDQNRLRQILINLVNNAVKFTNAGKVTLTLQKEEETDKQVLVKFAVTDTGIGIAAENLGIIFDPFIQDPQVISNDYGGTGLGLAITKRLIELYKSTIQVTSELGVGTEFSFSLLFDVIKKPQPEPKSGITVSLPLSLTGLNVLVVDDNKMNIMIATRFLKKWEANVDEALNGEIAVEMAGKKAYDIIIMDLQMPVMDGFEASAIIKQKQPNIPIIAFTADAMPETYNKALEAGMCDYLTKPFVPEVLFGKISKHCNITTVQQAN